MPKYIILIVVFLLATWYYSPVVVEVEVGLIWPSESNGSVLKARGD